MAVSAEAQAVLDAVSEPVLLLNREGVITAANRRGRMLLGSGAIGQALRELQAADAEALDLYLSRCLGSVEGLAGALVLRCGGRVHKHRCRGSRAALPDGAGVFLRLEPGDEARFVALSRKVAELNNEVRDRRHAEAVLAEALRDRDLLLRELQHRVKNNVHMLSSLLQGAERETASLEAKAVLRDASLRVAAVSAVQQLIYGARDLESIEATDMIAAVAQGAVTLAAQSIDLSVSVEPCAIPLEAAVAVALIVNELVTNAVKHGRPREGRQAICVDWRTEEDHVFLAIEDNGAGFAAAESSKRASGLGLVRGLLRQLGGTLTVESNTTGGAQGARCVTSFPVPRERQGGHRAWAAQ